MWTRMKKCERVSRRRRSHVLQPLERSQCVNWPYAKMGMIRDMIRYGIRFRRDPHAAVQNVKIMGIVVSCGKVTFKDVHAGRCLMSHIGHLSVDSADQEEEIMDVSGELHEHEQWEPQMLHYDYYTGEPLDEDLYQRGRDDELRAMLEYGVYTEIPISEAVGGKHIRGFPIYHLKG